MYHKNMGDLIRVAKPYIGEEEINEVVDTLKSGWITYGPKVAKFEEELAKYLGVKYVVTTNSCTAAFHILLMALDIQEGDEVITPALTFASLGNILVHLKAKPVFVDVNRDTLTLDLDDVKRKITNKTRFIVPNDYAGLPADIDGLRNIIGESPITIVGDAATSFGANYKNKKVGAAADYTCFSFYPTKNITTIEGGAISTNSEEIAEKIRLLSKVGVSSSAWKRHAARNSWYFDVVLPGLKYHMTDVNAAVGLQQLKRIDYFISRRREIARRYYDAFKNLEIIKSPYPEFPEEHVWNFYPILVNDRIERDRYMKEMEDWGVASSVYYIPMHYHTVIKNYLDKKISLPITEEIFSRVASLPMYGWLTDEEVDKVIKVVTSLDKMLL